MSRSRLLLVAGVVVAVLAIVVVVRNRSRREETAPRAAVGTWIEVYFTTPQSRGQPPSGSPGRLDERLAAAIDGVQKTLDMAIYDLELDNVADAMLRAKGRGAQVRVVTDTDNAKNAAVERLRGGGVPVVEDGRGPTMHHKFAVLDGESVWMGSWNFTPKDTFQYNNNAALIRSRELAANYAAEFDKMFSGRRFGPAKPKEVPNPRLEIGGATVETIFESEGDAPGRIIERIRGARDSVIFLAFTFTHDGIGEAIEERYRAGVTVRGVIERLQSDRPESELGRFRRAGMGASRPAGAPRESCKAGPGVLTDGNPQLMHHKVIVIDAKTVIFGSFNFTRNAAEDNDENLLIVDDPAVAARFLDEFCRVYNVAVERGERR
jgi:phosphatidylserine/phosphatidylglycerophosphate/cardiolipin synthase-like enzyme